MKNITCLLLSCAALISMAGHAHAFDLSTVALGKDASAYELENKKLFLKDAPKADAAQYYADENKQIAYGAIPLDPEMGTRISVYKGKIGAVDTNAAEKASLEFAEKIAQKYGKPVAALSDTATLEPALAARIFTRLQKIAPEKVSWKDESKRSFTYPTSLFWSDGASYTILSLNIENDGRIRNRYITASKEAYQANAVYGLKYPAPPASPWYAYMK